MGNTLRATDFLKAKAIPAPPEVCVLFGEEAFLKRRAMQALRQRLAGGPDAEFALQVFEGPNAQWADVLEELATQPMFGGKRLVVVQQADAFVTQYRALLEEYASRPRSTGVLVLDVHTWPATTRLYKMLDAGGLQIDCRPLRPAEVPGWVAGWARQEHGIRLTSAAASALVEMIGPELGLLDQELAKLAVSAGRGGTVDVDLVRQMAAWRARTAWDMLDAALEGDLATALAELDRLLLAGESPVGILGQVGASLRRLAAATSAVLAAEAAGRKLALRDALRSAGVNPYYLEKTERQLRRLGRQRGQALLGWLLEADLALKGASQLAPRIVLETLLVRLGAPAASTAGGR